ncbi:hypothetical protein GRI89_03530 [Altererythrobacter salegens]|uniref:Uncharacterized protein n=1 Tax=Croceibacterium salegens TaxID=1737568 RepID=A0A6I4SW90_9SPHN|nr:glycosyltransferase family 39 protein [Croceibacterium salegens]MXO58612.1 hypothetical protein [Croceibacterium salegens]
MDATTTIAPSVRRQAASRIPRDWFAAGALLLVLVATRGFWFGDPVADFDEQIYSLIGWRMTHGDLPYVEIWDRKPFLLYAIYFVAHGLFGPSAAAYQFLASLSAFAGAWLVYKLSCELVDRASATVAGSLYLMLMAAYGSYSGQSEIFHTPLMLSMLWLLRDWRRPDAAKRAMAAMLIGGIALQVKYTVLPQCAFFGAWALLGQWRAGTKLPGLVRLAAIFAALGVLPTVLVAAFYAAVGHFDEFWFANFVSFFEREPAFYGRLQPGQLFATLPLMILVFPGLYAALRLNPPRVRETYLLYCAFLVASLATVLLPSTVYLYYYGALVPAAVLVALPIIDRTSPGRFVLPLMLLAGAVYILNFPNRIEHSRSERRVEARLSDAIRPYVNATDKCLYVFDGPGALYRSTGTCIPTRFAYPDHLNNNLERRSLGVDQRAELARILATRPTVIVTANKFMTPQRKENLATIRRVTSEDYRPLTTVALHHRQITAWVLKDETP